MEPIETYTHNGYVIKIYPDDCAENPRDWDNVSSMVCFHRRYHLGDVDGKTGKTALGYREQDFSGWDDLKATIVNDHAPVVIKTLYLIDHSGISIRAGRDFSDCDPGGWDSGCVGFVFVSKAKAVEEFGRPGCRVTAKIRALCERTLDSEVEVYDSFLRGDVYSFVIETADGELVSSCSGFYSLEDAKGAALEDTPSNPCISEAEGGRA